MRVPVIQANYFTNTGRVQPKNNQNNVVKMQQDPLTSPKSELSSYSYGMDLVHRTSPSFKGSEISKTALALAQQFPVEERLASFFQILKHGDIILVGKNFNEAQKALKNHLSKFGQVIKKEYFIKDDKLKNYYAFTKNALGDIEILNVNDKKLFYTTGGKRYYLDPGDSFYITNNDTVEYGTDVLHLKEKPKADLSFHRHIFAKTFDMSKSVQNDLANLNKKTVTSLILESKGAPKGVKFTDIGGQAKAIKELKKSILFPVSNPDAYTNDDITRGFILYGPAGTGKTELCRALANEAGMNSSYISGTSVQSKWVGESEANVRAWFDELKLNQPSIGIIDEIDAITANRTGQDVYGDKLVDQILTCMTDIYNQGDDVFILGLTNKYDKLDPAIKRAERFSKHILVGEPDRDGVAEIFKIHTRNRKLDPNLNIDELVDTMYKDKVVGSDIKFITKLAKENMFERLGIYEKMENKTFQPSDMDNAYLTQEDFQNAIKEFREQHRGSSRNPIGFNK